MQYSFDIDTAVKYGVDAAIVLNHLAEWIMLNKARDDKVAVKRHTHNGKTWTYYSMHALTKIYPFWTRRQVRTTLENLIKDGVIVRDRFAGGYSQTNWYAFADETEFERIIKCQAFTKHSREGPGQLDEKVQSIGPKRPINGQKSPINGLKSPTTITKPIPIPVTLGLSNNCAEKLELDLEIAEKAKFFCEEISRIFYTTQGEARTFAKIAAHLVALVQTGKATISIFTDALEWARSAKASRVRNKKGLFVAKVKQETGFKGQRRLLRVLQKGFK